MLKNSLLGLLLAASTATMPATQLPEATAIKLDGAFTEAIWEQVPAVSDFRQRDPKDGGPPTFATDVKVAYDATNLYVAIRAHDPEPDRLVGLRTRRDTDSSSDWLKVIVDSFHDRRTAFEFGVNPAGVKEDRAWSNDSNDDSGWDAVWDVAVSRDKDGWRAEFRIPFSQLRFHPADNATFGFAVVRQIGRLNETDTWPHISKAAPGFVSSFGDLTGLTLEPDAQASRARALRGRPGQHGSRQSRAIRWCRPTIRKRRLGADLKYALRPGVTLTATVNPDFGQVEADPAVVNLSGFETFFSERRPFFVEGRRACSPSTSTATTAAAAACSIRGASAARRAACRSWPTACTRAFPQQTTILGAVKLTGHAGKFSFGAMNATTADEEAVVANGALRTRESVEPLSNFSVVRARREFDNQSTIGFIATATTRRLTSFTDFLPERAFTGGLDWDLADEEALCGHRLPGAAAPSSGEGRGDPAPPGEHRPQLPAPRRGSRRRGSDPHLARRRRRAAGVPEDRRIEDPLQFQHRLQDARARHQRRRLHAARRSADDEQLGPGAERHAVEIPAQLPLEPQSVGHLELRRRSAGSGRQRQRPLGVRRTAGAPGPASTQNARPFDDRATRGEGPGAYANPNWSYWNYVNSDDRKRATLSTFFNVGGDGHGSRWIGVSPGVTFRPTSFLSLNTGLDWGRNQQDAQWVENTADGRYVFGHLDQTTVSLTMRVNYTITPELSVQIYAAPFVSAGDYDRFKKLVDGRAARYEDRYAPIAYEGNPDFNYRSFRTTNVLRWEYKPGSALFVVWQQGREDLLDTGRFQFGPDFHGMFGAPARNAFLVKWSYWINQ